MSSVDDRIVNMKFENSQFKTGAAESAKALEGLDRTIANTGKGVGLTTLASGVDGIKTKFSAMQVAGTAALATIASKATSTGLNLLKSLTIDPITQGFQEYQTNLNSIQTVVANTGKSVDVVNGYMNQLNKYSDQTVYNFSEMAKNIGTFTAAGVDLPKATASIQGIANLAALSGSNSQQASTAMYQLSQAIAAGRVSLMDWNSVVNAGMGGKIFQNALAQTSVAMGELQANAVQVGDKVTIMGKSFRESIGGGDSFLTGESLVNTLAALDGRFSSAALAANGFNTEQERAAQILKARNELEKQGVKYTDEQFASLVKTADSAYEAATTIKSFPQLMQVVKESIGSVFSNSFSLILGDFEQSKALWGAVGKSIVGPKGALTQMGNAWTGLLKDFVDSGGRTKVLSGLGRIFRNLGKVMGALKGAFTDIFPPATSQGLRNIAQEFNRFTRNFALHKDTVENLKRTFAGFFAILHIGFTIVKTAAGLFFDLFGALTKGTADSGGGILAFTGGIGDALVALDKFLTGSGSFFEKIQNLGGSFDSLIGPVVLGFNLIADAVTQLANGASLDRVVSSAQMTLNTLAQFGGPAAKLKSVLSSLSDGFVQVRPYIAQVGNALQNAGAKISEFTNSGSSLGNFLGTILGVASKLASAAGTIGTDIIAGIVSGITGASFGEVQAAIVGLGESIIQWFKDSLGIHSPSTEMAAQGRNVTAGVAVGITDSLATIGHAIGQAGHYLIEGFKQMFGGLDALDVAALINAALSGGLILALTNFTKVMTKQGGAASFSDILKGGIVQTFRDLGKTLEAFQAGIKAKALLDIAIAVGVLVASIVVLSLIDPEKIAISLGAIAIMMGLLVGTLSALNKFAKGGLNLAALSVSISLIAAAMITLAIAVAIFGSMDINTLVQGLGGLAIALGLMVGALVLLSKFGGAIEGAAGSIYIIAGAMVILAAAVLAFGSMDINTLAQGLGGLAIALGIMVGALVLLAKFGGKIEGAAGAILIISGAMVVLATAVGILGSMNIGTLTKGLVAMAIGLALMVGTLLILSKQAPAVLIAAQAMLIMSAAMIALATAVGIFGNMDTGTLAKGFIAIALGFAILIAAAFAAQYVLPGLIILGVTLGAIGSAMFLAGAGMLAFATGFAILVAVGSAGIAFLSVAFEAFLALLPTIAIQAAASVVAFVQAIAAAAPKLREAFSTIFASILGVLTDAIPEFGKLMQTLITTGISILRHSIPQFIALGVAVLDAFLEAARKEVPHIADVALDIIESFLTVIDNHLGNILDKGTDIIVKLINGLGKAGAKIIEASVQAVLDILHAIDQAVVDHIDEFRNVGLSIAGHILDGLTGGLASKGAGLVGKGLDAIGLGRTSAGRGGNPIASAQAAVNAANALVSADVSEGDPTVARAQAAAIQASGAAAVLEARAEAARKVAADLAKKANKKGAGKAIKDKAEAAQKEADKAANRAEAKRALAENAAQNLQDAISFRDADNLGKGDQLADDAADIAQRASDFMAKANAEVEQAKKLTGKAAKKMLEQAKKDAATANRLAEQAKQSQEQANAYYAKEVAERIKAMEDAAAEEAADKAYEAADSQTKADIMTKRAAADQARADAAKAEAARLVELAKNTADPTQALAYLDQAEEQAAIAKEAADKAEQERQTAEQVLSQPGTSSGGGTGSTIQPSRSVLEDAARATDRYTDSLAEAQALAGGASGPIQYVQNVYSPTQLDAGTVYRQSKNLVSAQNVKMGP